MCEFVGERDRLERGEEQQQQCVNVRARVRVSVCPYLQESILKLEERKKEIIGARKSSRRREDAGEEGRVAHRQREGERRENGLRGRIPLKGITLEDEEA